jgi:glutathione S-transferase
MITLYTGPLSLFARKVEIALGEKGLAFERITVPFNQTTGYDPKHPEVLALNPKGQVPVLSDAGLVVYDSTVILEYLDEAYPEPPLYPKSPAERARCRLDELYSDEIMHGSLRALMHRTTPPTADQTKRAALEADALIAEAELTRHYAVLEDRLAGRAFFSETLSAADIALFMSMLYSQRLGGPPLTGFEGLSAWFARLSRRQAFAQVAGEMAEADRRLSHPVVRRT